MNIVIPLAGLGTRFSQAGYTLPKPLISVRNMPMIQLVVENLNLEGNYIFIAQEQHCVDYNLENILKTAKPDCTIIKTPGVTEGAACTVLLATQYIDNNMPLLIANSDQYVDYDNNVISTFAKYDGGILTFTNDSPKWSYAKVEDDKVVRVAEKEVISNEATVGVYYWKHGKDFVKYTNNMITKNIRVNNEFYVCPVYNEAINDGKHIVTSLVDNMYGLGTPEDLNNFLANETYSA
jgi:dTDP-glucose pyrophosphorylase